jgi:hypothetical protein
LRDVSSATAIAELIAAAGIDLGDHLRFEVTV